MVTQKWTEPIQSIRHLLFIPHHLSPRQGFGLVGRAVQVRFGFDVLEASAHALFGATLGDGQARPSWSGCQGAMDMGSICGEPTHRRNPDAVIGWAAPSPGPRVGRAGLAWRCACDLWGSGNGWGTPEEARPTRELLQSAARSVIWRNQQRIRRYDCMDCRVDLAIE